MCWPKELGLLCTGRREPWEGAELWAELHFGTPVLLQPGPENAETTILIYLMYPLIPCLFP